MAAERRQEGHQGSDRKSTNRGHSRWPISGLTLVTQRPLPGAPLEALDDAVLDRAQQRLVHLQGGNDAASV